LRSGNGGFVPGVEILKATNNYAQTNKLTKNKLHKLTSQNKRKEGRKEGRFCYLIYYVVAFFAEWKWWFCAWSGNGN